MQQEELFRDSQPHREYTQSSHAIVVPVEDCGGGHSILRPEASAVPTMSSARARRAMRGILIFVRSAVGENQRPELRLEWAVKGDQVIRENPASRGTETSAEVLVAHL